MGTSRMKFADLDDASLDRLRIMEQAYDAVILAVEPVRPVAQLTEPALDKIKRLEGELGIILIAYPSE